MKSVKNLGTWIDSNLGLQEHRNNTRKAAYFHFTNVRCIRKYSSNEATQTLVHALITRRIDLCNSILCGLPAIRLTKLPRLQNSAARVIYNLPKQSRTTPVLNILHWLPVKFVIDFKVTSIYI